MTERGKLRLFLDSKVLTGGFFARWGLDKAVLSLCAAKIHKLVLAEAVREEVEDNVLEMAETLPGTKAEQLLEEYRWLIELCKPEIVPHPNRAEIEANRDLTVTKPTCRCFFPH